MTDELKPIARLPPLPTEVFADPGRHDWYFRDSLGIRCGRMVVDTVNH